MRKFFRRIRAVDSYEQERTKDVQKHNQIDFAGTPKLHALIFTNAFELDEDAQIEVERIKQADCPVTFIQAHLPIHWSRDEQWCVSRWDWKEL
ncbi:MAG: hypothetical protein HY741_29970 [Chloroflexi bacterium]|nr:hypothetical protein [Chloroflexota bacterium]